MPPEPASRPRLRFRRRHRLSGARAFGLVFREGRRAAGRLLVLYVRPDGAPEPRLGLSVGRRVGKATVRNAVKRRLREVFRLMLPELERPVDVVVVPLTASRNRKSADLEAEFRELLQRALRVRAPR
jgi:ribonuclease P protein component